MSTVEIRIDGVACVASSDATLLEACDAAGRYVPRLCYYPGLGCCAPPGFGSSECGLCSVRLHDGRVVLACITKVTAGVEVTTQDPGLAGLRRERLGHILRLHPHVCLTCAESQGCARDHCTYGHAMDARCCDELGSCELGKLVTYLDPDGTLCREVVAAGRDGSTEGRIRRQPGLCVGCGRCVAVCDSSPRAGRALAMQAHAVDGVVRTGPAERAKEATTVGSSPVGLVSHPKLDTLRASGCTFCGQCVMVCPAGALAAPGQAGARWLQDRPSRNELARPVLPPAPWREICPRSLSEVPSEPGVFLLVDSKGDVLRIGGVPDLRAGLDHALSDPAFAAAARFMVDVDPLFTQRESELLAQFAREHGHLPLGNDPTDELFDEDLNSADM